MYDINSFELSCQCIDVYHLGYKGVRSNMNTIGNATKDRIIQLCDLNNISINKLGIISGVTQSTLNNIISGRNNSTTLSTIKKICDGLDISIQDFFDSDLFNNLDQELK